MTDDDKAFSDRDPLFEDAARLVVENNIGSASFLQRKMSIGYARAAKILDELQEAEIVGPADGAIPREVFYKSYSDLLKAKPKLFSYININKLIEKTGPFSRITQYSLFFSVLIVIIGQFRLTDSNTKLLYSLCMIIGASIGRTGSDVSDFNYQYKFRKFASNMWQRSIAFNILWLFGILGLIL